MQIDKDSITFADFEEFRDFLFDCDLVGKAKLMEPIEDQNGAIFVKEEIAIKESTLTKLVDHRGQYKANFKIALTSEVLEPMRKNLVDLMLRRITVKGNDFLKHLFSETTKNYRAIVQYSLYKKSLILLIFRLAKNKQEFFEHICDLGLLHLGIMILKNLKVGMIHRYAFLSGLYCDISQADSNEWVEPQNGTQMRNSSAKSATIADKMILPAEIGEAIRNHYIMEQMVNEEHLAEGDSVFDGILPSSPSPEKLEDWVVQEEEDAVPKPPDERLALLLTEGLRISRYLHESAKELKQKENLAEELLYMLVYSSSKGYFHEDFMNALIPSFKEFEANVRKIRKIAAVEKKCLYPPSAWAYPKPKATQILCKNNVTECPKMVSGWDLHIIEPVAAYGRIGSSLNGGKYSKCALEKELEPPLT